MKLYIPVVAALMLFTTAAFANNCPNDMKKIDEAMAKKPTLTAAQMADVKKYRAEGEAMHKAGKHKESAAELSKAMAMLNIKP
jgi:hypothetical protein